jgi:hypothetical protein
MMTPPTLGEANSSEADRNHDAKLAASMISGQVSAAEKNIL